MPRFEPIAQDSLLRAGWFQGRNEFRRAQVAAEWVTVAGFDEVEGFRSVIAEFGGLTIGQSGPGLECARSQIIIEPTLMDGEDDRFARVSSTLGFALSPLGEVGPVFCGLGADGGVYFFDIAIWRAGRTVDQALNALLVGRVSQIRQSDGTWADPW